MDIMRMDTGDHHQQQQMTNSLDGSSTTLDPGKIFVGGLSWQTTNESLRQYFSQFGEVVECMVMKDQTTKRSRGFGFVNFVDATSVDKVLASGPHDVDAKRVDPKKSFPRPKLCDGQLKLVTRTKKMFVGGLSSTTTVDDVKSYFEQFGKVEDAMLMYDKQTQRHRGFAFVTFENEETVDKVVDVHYHDINNKTVECKKAQPKSLMDTPTVKGLIPVGLTPVLATAYGRTTGFPIANLPHYYAYTGLPYGYLTTGTAGGTAAAISSDRLLAGTAPAGGTTYFTTTDYGSPALGGTTLSLVPVARGGNGCNMAANGAPASPTMREQFILQRMVPSTSGTAAAMTSRGLLSLQDYATAEYSMMNGYAGTPSVQFSPMSPIHNGHNFSQSGGSLLPIGATFPGATLTGLHAGYQ
jgi:RNA-binding protein Musashi